ncbi:MAG: hypothetical protein NTY03_02730, partial [Candidatus Bathyarchaeota archaeon]|nr:hypothetical protein [Candidatus Bathyarchaeota archaeon]
MVELETINLLVQIVGVSAAAIATVVGVRSYIVSNRRAEEARKRELETRQAQLFMSIYTKSTEYEFRKRQIWLLSKMHWVDYYDFIRKYG